MRKKIFESLLFSSSAKQLTAIPAFMFKFIVIISLISYTAGLCYDSNRHCNYWAGEGECVKNSKYMHKNCPVSCNSCVGISNSAPDLNKQIANDVESDKKHQSYSLTALPVDKGNLAEVMEQYADLPFWGSLPSFYTHPGAYHGLYTANPWLSSSFAMGPYGLDPFYGWLPFLKKK